MDKQSQPRGIGKNCDKAGKLGLVETFLFIVGIADFIGRNRLSSEKHILNITSLAERIFRSFGSLLPELTRKVGWQLLANLKLSLEDKVSSFEVTLLCFATHSRVLKGFVSK